MSLTGANIVILGRVQHTLDLAKQDVFDARISSKQTVKTFAVDLSVAEEVCRKIISLIDE
jgi:hypothetical protein